MKVKLALAEPQIKKKMIFLQFPVLAWKTT